MDELYSNSSDIFPILCFIAGGSLVGVLLIALKETRGTGMYEQR